MTLRLDPKRFNLNNIKKGATILLVAKRRSGKSICVKQLMYHFDKHEGIKTGIVCSHSEDIDPFYQHFFPSLFIYHDCLKGISKVIARQRKLLLENEERKKKGLPEKDSRILVVLDDVIDDIASTKNSQVFSDLMFNGRHYNITFIIAVQFAKALPPATRANFDYVFIFANDIGAEIKKMYEAFAGFFPTESIFRQALQHFTKNYHIMVLDLSGGATGDWQSKFLIFKADINLKYDKFGSDKFNKCHQVNYDPEWQKRDKGLIVGYGASKLNVVYN